MLSEIGQSPKDNTVVVHSQKLTQAVKFFATEVEWWLSGVAGRAVEGGDRELFKWVWSCSFAR